MNKAARRQRTRLLPTTTRSRIPLALKQHARRRARSRKLFKRQARRRADHVTTIEAVHFFTRPDLTRRSQSAQKRTHNQPWHKWVAGGRPSTNRRQVIVGATGLCRRVRRRGDIRDQDGSMFRRKKVVPCVVSPVSHFFFRQKTAACGGKGGGGGLGAAIKLAMGPTRARERGRSPNTIVYGGYP